MRRTRSFRSIATTPTASSEASWNSQTGLLSAPPGSLSVSFKHPLSSDKRTAAPAPAPPFSGGVSNITYVDVDDGASDASSDLFEIESFTTQQTTTTESTTTTAAHPSMFLFNRQRRDSLEEAAAMRRFPPISAALYHPISGLTAADYGYEPSEASIDWSVTTAEGFDRASVANASEADFGEYFVATSSGQPPHVAAVEKNRRRSSGNGLLMSCRCEKAVSVGPGPRPMSRVVTRPSSSGGGGERARAVGQGISLSSSSTLAMWAVGQKGQARRVVSVAVSTDGFWGRGYRFR
uniref:Uncharacterized protein n=1 Tax=Cannabis sativa TaxID=3483 RepID=A0A803Q440_CANSA